MSSRTVSGLLAEDPEFGELASCVEPGHSPPSKENAQDIWKFLTSRILPSMAEQRCRGLPRHIRDFKSVQTLALAAQITDFDLRDYREPTAERWHSQMSKVDAYLRFCHSLYSRVQPETHAMNEVSSKLNELRRTKEEAQLQLDVLERQRGTSATDQRAQLAQRTQSLEELVLEKKRQLRELESDLNSHLKPREAELRHILDHLEQRHAQFVEHVELIRPALARGASVLRPEVTSLERETNALESERRSQEELAKKCVLTLQVLSQLKLELDELVQAKGEAQSLQTKRQIYESDKFSKASARKDQLAAKLTQHILQDERLSKHLRELERGLESLRKELKELQNSTESDNRTESGAEATEEELKNAQLHVEKLTSSNQTLSLTIQTHKKWLHGMESLDREGKKLVEELEVVKQWMKLYLNETKRSDRGA